MSNTTKLIDMLNVWDINDFEYVDQGGYSFSYNQKHKVLKIETGFGGYSHSSTLFIFTHELNKEFLFQLDKLYKILLAEDENLMKNFCSTVSPIHSESTTIVFSHEVLTFKSEYSLIRLGAIWNKEVVGKLIEIFNKILSLQVTNMVFHPKSTDLLYSMAYQSNVRFLLLEESEKNKTLNIMNEIYDLFEKDSLDPKAIEDKYEIDKTTLIDIIKEIQGKGMYN